MKIETRTVGDIHFLDCSGRITMGVGAGTVRQTVGGILRGGGKKIALNLAEVTHIDGAGVGELVRTYTAVAKNGGQLNLLGLTERMRKVLEITKLLTVFQAFDSEMAAVEGFA